MLKTLRIYTMYHLQLLFPVCAKLGAHDRLAALDELNSDKLVKIIIMKYNLG